LRRDRESTTKNGWLAGASATTGGITRGITNGIFDFDFDFGQPALSSTSSSTLSKYRRACSDEAVDKVLSISRPKRA